MMIDAAEKYPAKRLEEVDDERRKVDELFVYMIDTKVFLSTSSGGTSGSAEYASDHTRFRWHGLLFCS